MRAVSVSMGFKWFVSSLADFSFDGVKGINNSNAGVRVCKCVCVREWAASGGWI